MHSYTMHSTLFSYYMRGQRIPWSDCMGVHAGVSAYCTKAYFQKIWKGAQAVVGQKFVLFTLTIAIFFAFLPSAV